MTSADDELERFRQTLTELGYGEEAEIGAPIERESAEKFVKRMKRRDAQRRLKRVLLAGAIPVAAAAVVTAIVVVSPNETTPTPSPVLAVAPMLQYSESKKGITSRQIARPALAKAASDAAASLPTFNGSSHGQAQVVTRAVRSRADTGPPQFDLVQISTMQNGSQRIRTIEGGPLNRLDQANYVRGLLTAASETSTNNGRFDPDILSGIRRSPTLAREVLLKASNCSPGDAVADPAWCLFNQVSAVWENLAIDRKAAVNMWSVLAREADVTSLGEVIDRAGRAGTAIAAHGPDGRTTSVLIISRRTGGLLGTETITQANASGGAARVESFSTIIKGRDLPKSSEP